MITLGKQIEMICNTCGRVEVSRELYTEGVKNDYSFLNHPDDIVDCCGNPDYYRR